MYRPLVQPHTSSYGRIAINFSQLNYKKLQNRTARILTSSSYDANVDDLFLRLGSGKNLIFDENSKKKLRKLLNGINYINYLMVLPLVICNLWLLIGVKYLTVFFKGF